MFTQRAEDLIPAEGEAFIWAIFSNGHKAGYCSANTSELDAEKKKRLLEYVAGIDKRERSLFKGFKQSPTIFMAMIVNEKYRAEAACRTDHG